MTYDPAKWFWLADDGRLFSSAQAALIQENDEAYAAWVEAAHQPTPWPRDDDGAQTDDTLQEVLSPFGLFCSLAALKVGMKKEIDAAAERERLKYITPGAGQAMTYQQKMEEVRALAQDPDPEPGNYPLLSAEIGITAPTVSEVAAVVLSAYQQWQHVGARIEASRLAAKKTLSEVETVEEAKAMLSVLVWPSAQ